MFFARRLQRPVDFHPNYLEIGIILLRIYRFLLWDVQMIRLDRTKEYLFVSYYEKIQQVDIRLEIVAIIRTLKNSISYFNLFLIFGFLVTMYQL